MGSPQHLCLSVSIRGHDFWVALGQVSGAPHRSPATVPKGAFHKCLIDVRFCEACRAFRSWAACSAEALRRLPRPCPRVISKELGVPAVHQRGRHLHRHDGVADAARGDDRRSITRRSSSCTLNELHDARRRADRHADRMRGGHGDRGRRVGALTLGTAACSPARTKKSSVDLPNTRRHEDRGHHAEVAPLRIRPRRAQLRRQDRRSRDGRPNSRRAITPQTAMMLFYNDNNSVGQIRDEEFVASARSTASRR